MAFKFLLVLSLLFIPTTQTIYQFKVAGIDGSKIDFAKFKGKKILVVNVASECGYTYQYEDLQKLYEKYKDKLVIVGFPANDFGSQEPGSNEEIQKFCTGKYNVTFPMAAKISVKGDDMAPIYKWLTTKTLNGVEDNEVSWNFNKYLIDENGQYVAHFKQKVKPFDSTLVAAIEK